jgi:CRP-like cAMP-binding protein
MAATFPSPVLEQIVSALEAVPLFEGVDRHQLEEIGKLVRSRSVKAGDVLFREGDAADKFYIVQSGCIQLTSEKEGIGTERPGIKRAGQSFGEIALVSDAPRTATACAIEATNLLVIAREQFEHLLGGGGLATHVIEWLAKSLAAASVPATKKAPGDAPGTSWKTFSRQLQRSLMPPAAPKVPGFETNASIAQDEEGNAQAIWCSVPFAGGGTLFAVLDARGESLPAGYVLGVARAALYAAAANQNEFRSVLTLVNEAVFGSVSGSDSARVQAGLLLLNGTTATFSIAGENPAMVVKYDAETQGIAQHGPALGSAADTEYGATRAEMSRGDCAVMFSQSDRGLLLAAADLISGRHLEPIATTATSLHKALMRAQHYRRGDDISFVIARKT